MRVANIRYFYKMLEHAKFDIFEERNLVWKANMLARNPYFHEYSVI